MSVKTFAFSAIAVFSLMGCSSGAKEPSTTTIDPAIEKLQEQVEELQNATTLPPVTNAPKPAPTVVRESRRATGYTTMDSHECRHTTYYSDGTQQEEKYWVKNEGTGSDKWDC